MDRRITRRVILISGVLLLTLATVIFGLPLAATSFLAIPVALLGTLAFMPFAFFLVSLCGPRLVARFGTRVVSVGGLLQGLGIAERDRCLQARAVAHLGQVHDRVDQAGPGSRPGRPGGGQQRGADSALWGVERGHVGGGDGPRGRDRRAGHR